MTLNTKERARIEAAINELKAILAEDDKPKTYAQQTNGVLSPVVDVSEDWVAIEIAMQVLGLTWQSPRILAYLDACAKRSGKPVDKRYLSADAIATLRKNLEGAIA